MNRSSHPLRLVFIISAILYLAACALLDARGFNPILIDSHGYIWMTRGIVRGQGFASIGDSGELIPTFIRTPGYPVFLSAFFSMAPEKLAIHLAVWAQRLFWLMTVLVIAGRWTDTSGEEKPSSLGETPRSKLLPTAGILVALLSPVILVNASQLITECLFTVLLWVALLLVPRVSGLSVSNSLSTRESSHRKRGTGLAAITGLLMGVAILVRPIAILIPAMFAVLITVHWVSRRARLSDTKLPVGKVLVLLTLAYLLPLGWTVRNQLVAGHFGFSTISGVTYALHMQPYIESIPPDDPLLTSDKAAALFVEHTRQSHDVYESALILRLRRGMDEFESDAVAKRVFRRSLILYPLGYAKRCVSNLVNLLSGPSDTLTFLTTLAGEHPRLKQSLGEALQNKDWIAVSLNAGCRLINLVTLLLLPLLGLVIAGRNALARLDTWLFLGTYIYFVVTTCMMTVANTRFAFPLIPAIVFCCAAPMITARQNTRSE